MGNEGKSYFFSSDSLKSLDDQYVEGYISTGDKDLVNDIVTANCMVDMLAQMKNRVITLDVEHETFRGKDHVEKEINKSLNPIAKVTEASLDGKGIKVKTKLNSYNPRYEEIKGSIQDEFLNAFSIAYVPVDFKTREDGTRLLDKVNLLNITFTGVPVNPEASITNVMLKSISDGGFGMTEQKVQAEAKAVDAGVKLENLEVKSLSDKVDSLAKELSELKALAKKKAEADKEDEDKEKEAKADAEKEDDDKEKESKSDDEDEDDKETETKKKAFEAQEVKVKALEASLKAIEVAMAKPQFKAILDSKYEAKSIVESKPVAKGPVDYI